uniref:SWIM-type domain-containing protein n=1 Tax=Lepeophtheirus salmonis TaxID=72036 RepID=A0A0K2TKH9_LEPSM
MMDDVGGLVADLDENFDEEVEDEDEDSVCSWMSDSESVVHNWRGWKVMGLRECVSGCEGGGGVEGGEWSGCLKGPLSLCELGARSVARWIPFELVERYYPPVPEEVQLRIAFWSFPEREEDIRLYSCLANGCVEEYSKGEALLRSGGVRDSLQIGFHLSATVVPSDGKASQSTSITFDRKRIVSCQCSCESKAEWCSHIVASSLYRIHRSVTLRAPVSESLSRLRRDQLQKFAQYLIAELPLQILPAAQKILDELLSQSPTAINTVCGAPDPTAGGSASELSSFYLDSKNLKNNISTILIKFCVPSPIVFSDVNYLSTTPPLSAAEWTSYLRPLRGREPEGIWNLLSIVREMFRRCDHNALPLLEILTLQCIETAQIMVWWFYTKVALQQKGPAKHNVNSNSQASQNACAYLCDEIVTLWKLATLNPCISPQERQTLKQRLIYYHTSVIHKIKANQNSVPNKSNNRNKINELEMFPGFKPAIEGCILDWKNYPINGVTFGHNSKYLSPFAIFKQNPSSDCSQVNSSQAVIRCEYPTTARSHRTIARESNESDEGVEMNGNNVESVHQRIEPQDENDRDSDWSSSAQDSGEVRRSNSHVVFDVDNQEQEDLQYRVYFYDSGVPINTRSNEKDKELVDVFKNLRSSIDDPWEVLFLRTEGLYAHGHIEHACSLAVHLANDMLKSTLDLLAESRSVNGGNIVGGLNKRHKRNVNAATHQVTLTASNTLSHCAFLCSVLLENESYHSLAFQIAMYGLEMPRPPASIKPMEVKLANQESELVNLLKRVPQGQWELNIIREKALQLKEGTLKSRGDALLPLTLASFIFESLVLPLSNEEAKMSTKSLLLYTDEHLGFEAAVEAIGMKASVSEADHPLLCEGTRRQRGELVLILLLHYKNEPLKISKIMDKFLDKEVHPLFKGPITPHSYCVGNATIFSGCSSPSAVRRIGNQFQSLNLRNESSYERDYHRSQSDWGQFLDDHKEESLSNRHNRNKGTRNRGNDQASDSGSSGNSSADSIDSSSSSSAVLRVHQAHNSSDTSLTWIRKTSSSQSLMHGGLVHFGSGAISNRGPTLSSVTTNSNIAPRPIVSGLKINRFRGKRNCPSLPNQPSDSLAHFMYELAKTVLTKAGGNSSTSLFNQQTASSNHRGPHRALLMCAFQIGLYSLGLYNAVTSNWLSRTYSSQVHWVTSQALEIGTPAIEFLIGTWEGHLSPTEAVSIADRVSRGRDPHVIRASAELALSVLPHASALKVTEIQRAICQCQQQSQDMLERACLAVEKAATGGGVYPEVLFEVAKHWFSLWEKSIPNQHHEQQSLQISQHSVPNIAPQDSQAIHQQLQVATGVHYPFYGLISRFPQGQALNHAALQMYAVTSPPPAPSLSGHHLQQQFQAAAAVQRQAAVQAVAAAAAAVANPPPFQMYPSGGNSPVSVTTAHTRFGGIYQLSAAIPSGQIGSLLSASPSGTITQIPVTPALSTNLLPHLNSSCCSSSVGQKQPTQTVQSGVPFLSNANSVGHVSHRFLISAYRVGMLALESLGRRTTEERPEVRFAQNPTYGPDVMWLKSISRMLGLNYFQNFLVIIGATIASPFLLQELTLEGAINLACAANSGAQSGIPSSSSVSLTFSNTSSSTGNTVGYSTIMQSIRSNPHLTQLASKCYQMYYQCIHQRLFQLAPEDYEEFASIILHARKAFYWTVEGPRTFQTLLQSIRRSKSCTKELWQKVLSRVQNTTIEQL